MFLPACVMYFLVEIDFLYNITDKKDIVPLKSKVKVTLTFLTKKNISEYSLLSRFIAIGKLINYTPNFSRSL